MMLPASRDAEIEACLPAMRRFARRLTKGGAHADDLVQEALLRALGKWSLLRSRTSLKSWLLAILYNLFLETLRRSRIQPLELEWAEVNSPSTATPEEFASASSLLRAMDRLSDEHRTVLHLVAVEGLSYAEVSAVLGIPKGTVMSRLSRARSQFRDMIGGTNVVPLRSVS
jgi:RNA polymerase sigma-70 factor (ECF subfamily)